MPAAVRLREDYSRDANQKSAASLMRVGIEFPFKNEGWLGGINAIANLVQALSTLPDPKIEPVIIAAPNTPESLFHAMPAVKKLRTGLVDHSRLEHLARRFSKRMIQSDPLMEMWLRRNGIAVLSHGESLGACSHIASIGHIADFGYKYFKEIYSPGVWAKMDAGTARICNEYDTLMMSSEAVNADYRRFFPDARAKGVVLHFVPSISPRAGQELGALTQRHGIPDSYLYSPNQFWVHKNHGAIVEAIGLAAARGKEIHVVFTGAKEDGRRPDYFDGVMRQVAAKGLEDRFHILGIVPYEDTVDLMRHSIGVVSASLFEGFGLSVGEARMMGKSLILSDIPVFREQAPEYAFYFDPMKPRELAEIMIRVVDSYSLAEDQRRQAEADKRRLGIIRDYARGYEDIVLETVDRKKSGHRARTAQTDLA
jgi:glycosyltransferase involved in cell wall biosynthesis